MTREEFKSRFANAAAAARAFATRFVVDPLPPSLRFDLPLRAYGPADAEGRLKFLGGRLLTPAQLTAVEPARACAYLWVDGRIPRWVHLFVVAADAGHTHLGIRLSADLSADHAAIEDYHRATSLSKASNPVAPFLLRGPSLPAGWREGEKFGLAENARWWRAQREPGGLTAPRDAKS